MKGECCALTGHRKLPPNFNRNVLFDELEGLVKSGYTTFFCGMAMGFDLLALSFLVELKERYPLYLEACVPFKGQENSFSREDRLLYRELLLKCDCVTVLFDEYKNGCFLVRDRYMVDCADTLFAYCVKASGGSAYTVRYAKQTGRDVVFSKAGEIF